LNRGKHKPHRNGQPIRVRRSDWPEERESIEYPSAVAASVACGVVNGLGHVANPNNSRTYRKDKDGFKWLAEWAEPKETQDDLPPDPDYVDRKGVSKLQPLEVWRDAFYKNGKRLKNWRVSNRGRAHCKHPCGSGWGHRFTVKPTTKGAYATIAGIKMFHVAVYFSFGGTLVGDQTVDHVDCDETNNLLTNLRAASRSEQSTNKVLKPIEQRGNSRKHRVGCRRPSWPATTPTREFESQHAAARVLGVVSIGNIGKNINKTRYPEGHRYAGKLRVPTVGGYTFHKIVQPQPWLEDWGAQ